MTPHKKVKSGDRFKPPAETWNAFIDAARITGASQYGEGHDPKNLDPPKTCVTVVNGTGYDRRPGDVVEIDRNLRALSSELDNFSHWYIARPVLGTRCYGILREPLAKDLSGENVCQIAGVASAHVLVQDLTHRTANVVAGSHTLVSSENGPVILLYVPQDELSEIEEENVRLCGVVINQPMQCFLAEAQLDANMCTASNASLDPETFVPFKFGQYILEPGSIPIEAGNGSWYGHAGQTGDKVLLLYNDHATADVEKWIVVDVKKKEQTVVTDFEIDWVECCYTKSTRKCSVESCADVVIDDPVCQ